MASVREIVVTKQNAGQRAERFLKKYLNEAPLGFLYKLFRKKDVKANGHWIAKDYILQEGDVVRVYVSEEQLEDFKKPRAVKKAEFPYPIAYEDENVLIVNKPKGILVYGDKTGVRADRAVRRIGKKPLQKAKHVLVDKSFPGLQQQRCGKLGRMRSGGARDLPR